MKALALCIRCQKPIRVVALSRVELAALDPEPTAMGSVVIHGDGVTACVPSPEERDTLPPEWALYLLHRVSCEKGAD